MSKGRRIGFFVGSKAPFNVQRVASNIGWMLSNHFQLDLITTVPELFDAETRKHYTIHGEHNQATVLGQIKALREYLSTTEPDLLTHFTRPSLHGNLVSLHAIKNTVPFLYRYSGDIFYYYNGLNGTKKLASLTVRNGFGRIPLKIAFANIVLGPTGKRRLEQRGVECNRISTLPPSIDQDRFSGTDCMPDSLQSISDRKIILFVGRRTRMKGIETLNKAIPQIVEQRSDLQFVFVGGGDRIPCVGQHQDHVTIVGKVPPNEISSYYKAASCLILPSLSEGIPRVLLEALTTGTPVIARDVGDVASVTKNVFSSDEQFVKMVSMFEQLKVDDAEWFSRERLQNSYIETFDLILRSLSTKG